MQIDTIVMLDQVMLDQQAERLDQASELRERDDASQRRTRADGILVAGVELSPSETAELALRLSRAKEFALSAHVGRAVDQVRDHVELSSRDLPAILSAIGDEPPPGLARLQSALGDGSSDLPSV